MQVLNKFGYPDAEWLPYWDENNPFNGLDLPDDVYISMYRKEGLGSIVIIANLGDVPQQIKIKLEKDKLALTGETISVKDSLSGEDFPVYSSAFNIDIKSKNFRMLMIK